MVNKKHDSAIVIGNGGLGDMVTYVGMVNYLSTIYDKVIVSCQEKYAEHARKMYYKSNIALYTFQNEYKTMHYLYNDIIHRDIYDVYAFGNYGAKKLDIDAYKKLMHDDTIKNIIEAYPISYYNDVDIPFKYAWEYFKVVYPLEIESKYKELFELNVPYIVTHTISSNAHIDIFELRHLDKEQYLIIDINKNHYDKEHKFHDIAEKFINLPCITYYQKLIMNSHELYLIDSCLFALALITDISKVSKRECFKRESRFSFYSTVWKYTQLCFSARDVFGFDARNVLHI